MLKRPISLHLNEAPSPPPANVIAAARRGLERIHRYADPEDVDRLRGLLADHVGVARDHVVVGPGSDLLLRELVRTFSAGGRVITVSPTFLPTLEIVQQVAAHWTSLRLSPPTFTLEPRLLLAAIEKPCLIIIDNPNNPTGQILLDEKTVRAVLQKPGTRLIIDAAYQEFASWGNDEKPAPSFLDLVDEYENLAVTRTMDKAFSLAGARVGYAVVGMGFREAFAGYYALLPQPSLCAATEALDYPDYAKESVADLVAQRERLRVALQAFGAEVTPSHTNFLLVRTQLPDLAAQLRESGVLVSDVSNQLPPGYIRVSMGTPRENDIFLAVFKRITETAP